MGEILKKEKTKTEEADVVLQEEVVQVKNKKAPHTVFQETWEKKRLTKVDEKIGSLLKPENWYKSRVFKLSSNGWLTYRKNENGVQGSINMTTIQNFDSLTYTKNDFKVEFVADNWQGSKMVRFKSHNGAQFFRFKNAVQDVLK